MGVIGDIISAAEVEARIIILKDCIRDLTNDKLIVGAYNKSVDLMITDVQGLLGAGNSKAIVNKLCAYPEPDADSDSAVLNAKDYLRREINYLKGKTLYDACGR